MNKNLLLTGAIAFLALTNNAFSQSTFKLSQTTYVGALTSDAAQDWTTGWTNFDPKNAVYAAATDTTVLNGMVSTLPIVGVKDITTTVTLDAAKVYLLKGFIAVKSGGKLVIPAGTVIRGIADVNASPKNYATIVVERGGKIEITGTATNPVVMTSNKAVGSRDRGDWGGLVLCGKAVNNQLNGTDNNNVQLEGFNAVSFKDGAGAAVNPQIAFHGGTDNADNSGIIRYLRVEFAGLAFEANKEINGVTFGSVGSATEVKGIQVSFSNDDSFEWFGGTVNSSNLIAWKGTDDDFDTDFGYSGLSQFGLAVRDSALFDGSWQLATGASTSEGFESDNEAAGTSGTAAAIARTNCIFSNFTMVGPIPMGSSYDASSTETKGAFRRGARIRRNSSQRIVNSIFMGYRNFLMIDGDSTLRNTNWPAALALLTPNTAVNVKTRQTSFANNLIVNTTSAFKTATPTTANGLVEVAAAAQLTAIDAWVRQTGPLANKIDPVAFTAGTLLVNPSAYVAAPNFRPIANSAALSGANFKDNPVLENIVGIKDLKVAQFAPIYPNPILNGTLNFGREVVSFGIFDNTGKLILHGFDTNQVNINSLAKGMYFIKLDGQVQKFIVQ